MKKFILLSAMLCITAANAGAAKKLPPNPADYPLTAHVMCSFLSPTGHRQIAVTIDGVSMEMSTDYDSSVLVLGDYKARIAKDTSPDPYEIARSYEFLLPNGGTHAFNLSGFGNSLCSTGS